MALYRKSAIDRLSNPDQLDKAITISSPLSWLALAGIALAIAAALAWGILGRLPTTVTVSGVACGGADACAVYADCAGTVTQVLKAPGEAVREGERLAVIQTPDGRETAVLAKAEGTISRTLTQEGESAALGAELFRYTPRGEGQLFVCYVPTSQAAALEEGMKVLLYPCGSTQGSGRMEGCIETLGDYPAAVENMGYVLGTGNLMTELFTAQGPVTAVVCRSEAASVPGGALMTAKIITREAPPITKLLGGLDGHREG